MDRRLTSTFNTSAVISYVHRRRPEAVAGLLEGMDELTGLEPRRVEEVLTHRSGWVPIDAFSELLRRARDDIFADPLAPYSIAFEAMAFNTWGPLKSLFIRLVGSPANLARGAPWLIHRFSRSIRSIKVTDLTEDGCLLHVTWHENPCLSHINCQFTMGCLAALPLCFGRHPASLEEEACFFQGAPASLWRMSWVHLPYRERLKTMLYGVNARRARFLVDSLNQHVRQVELLSLESRQMAEALAQEQERFRILSEQSPLGLAFLDHQGNYLYTNPAFGRMFGYTPEQVPDGRSWMALAFPEPARRRQAAAAWKAYLATSGEGLVRERIFRVTCAGGEEKDVLFRSVGLAGQRHLVLMEDITARLAAEREQQRSAARLRAVVEGSPDSILLVDGAGKVIMANRAAAQLLSGGLPPQGKPWLDLLPPERMAWGRDLMEWVARGKVAREEVELPSGGRSGQSAFELLAVCLDPELTCLSLRNISHRRRLDEQRQEAARLAGVVELAGAAAHELNQPLTSLLASSELMLMYDQTEDLKRQARRMRTDALSLAELVERFGRIVRYETKEYLPGRNIIDLERSARVESRPPRNPSTGNG
ncbi:MAG: PAS domain S-box protein [Desulfarculaceae bacterium]|nr:PAS domain S-box protein [Desulfarculaceae bacterium]MCF8072534.1 PAS domain S-box protein [Desulfarculaceae bacterium]MCF8103437.1 PAS domain S-box protein [Desulfarculaceae bacterium]MCF8117075.1 PAS domain S-box protein [Desulfarculaceae bacterium]